MRALLIVLALIVFVPRARAEGFTPEQRQEVVNILREALRTDPSIIRDALTTLQTAEEKHHDQVTRDILTMLAPKIADPQDPVAGNPFGDVTVVEFYDTRCPYCRKMLPTMAELLQQDPKVKLVMKDMPILGNASQLESRALLALQRQGGYFKMQTPIMMSAAPSSRDSLRDEANSLGLDGNRMLRDMDDPVIKARLQNNLDLAKQIGIDGTPAFVIGTHLVSGAADLKELQEAIAAVRAGG
jgi:protein-disulfide isomerase